VGGPPLEAGRPEGGAERTWMTLGLVQCLSIRNQKARGVIEKQTQMVRNIAMHVSIKYTSYIRQDKEIAIRYFGSYREPRVQQAEDQGGEASWAAAILEAVGALGGIPQEEAVRPEAGELRAEVPRAEEGRREAGQQEEAEALLLKKGETRWMLGLSSKVHLDHPS